MAQTSAFGGLLDITRQKLVDLSVLKSDAWPTEITVLDPDLGHRLDGDPWLLDDTKEPSSAFGWATLPFRRLYQTPLHQVQAALAIWWRLHEQVTQYLIETHRFHKDTDRILAYNTTWALLGYVDNQAEDAIALADSIMKDPNFDQITSRITKTIQSTINSQKHRHQQQQQQQHQQQQQQQQQRKK